MIKHYLIDGNNLIGKMKDLWNLQSTDPQASRELLVKKIERYFAAKKQKISLHFDGHPGQGIRSSKVRIIYSYNKTADEEIKTEVTIVKNRKLICVVSSDHSIQNFARACSCEIMNSEKFAKMINSKNFDPESEESKIKSIDNEEMKRLFGL